MPEVFETVTRFDEEGTYVLLPEGCGFGPNEDVEIERIGDVIYVRHRGKAAPSVGL